MLVVITLLISLLAIIVAIKLHDKFDPARYFSLLWGLQIIIIYPIFHRLFDFQMYGLLYISLSTIVFSLGTFFGQFIGINIKSSNSQLIFNEKRAMAILKICISLAIAYAIVGVYLNGFNIFKIFSFQTLLELNNTAAVNRYSGLEKSSIITQLLLTFVYISPMYGGYLLPLLGGRHKFWCFFSLFPSLVITLTQAIKAGFITSTALFVIGVLISSYANNQSFIKIKFATIGKVALSILSFFSILFVSMVFRTGKFDPETVKIIGNKFIVYSLGHLPAFDLWFTKNIGAIEPEYGTKTFYGITNFLGIAERKQGVFAENYQFARTSYGSIAPEMETNVYSSFRFAIEDFGSIGSLIAISVVGIVSGFVWMAIKKKNTSFIYQIIFIAVMFYISWSFVASVWAYTSHIAAMVVMYFLLMSTFKRIPIVKNAEKKSHLLV